MPCNILTSTSHPTEVLITQPLPNHLLSKSSLFTMYISRGKAGYQFWSYKRPLGLRKVIAKVIFPLELNVVWDAYY